MKFYVLKNRGTGQYLGVLSRGQWSQCDTTADKASTYAEKYLAQGVASSKDPSNNVYDIKCWNVSEESVGESEEK